jgi:hypothetical protein
VREEASNRVAVRLGDLETPALRNPWLLGLDPSTFADPQRVLFYAYRSNGGATGAARVVLRQEGVRVSCGVDIGAGGPYGTRERGAEPVALSFGEPCQLFLAPADAPSAIAVSCEGPDQVALRGAPYTFPPPVTPSPSGRVR